MPRTLAPIPQGVPIVDPDTGTITTFYRLRDQALIDGFNQTSSAGALSEGPLHAALPTTLALLTQTSGRYRVSWYLRITTVDGAGSSAQVTVSFLDRGQALTQVGAALNTDTIGSWQTATMLVRADGNSNINVEVAYSSTTPLKMAYALEVTVEYLP